MAPSSFKQTIKSLRACLFDHDPVTFGVCPVPEKDLGLFYGKGDTARQLYLHTASDTELEHLARACTAASFGINQQDVYDETYRKAGKMDTEQFASKFDLECSGILARVKNSLLEHTHFEKPVERELYKLNVYGPGGFFKAHKDTPRGAKMFGSLVIVFPTKHTGGELKLRHGEKEWTFDSAEKLAAAVEPSIGYVAFFSDVEHEVAVVQSGYRVTLTYNLYFGETSPESASLDVNRENAFKSGLAQLLADPTFLPKGGLIGFGLQHEYPVSAETKLSTLMDCLKGSDALVRKVCEQLSLPIQPKMLTQTQEYYENEERGVDSDGEGGKDDCEEEPEDGNPDFLAVLTDYVVDLSRYGDMVDDAASELKSFKGALVLPYPDGVSRRRWDAEKKKQIKYSVDIQWITKSTLHTKLKTNYMTYGNEFSVDYLYGTVCFVAKIGPAGKRIT
ncbi:uncharacterized protein LOC129585614 [Paramacrobiotus metropolitanus]|uniref:uncharacterized protein LOC129585614 n=1 Tax=Paramacrobiotus metropolitanus TaxID=2943436 RepID=UPI00244618F2|nr:uncharacterized protein LOC129585614 [Paramacrobiotus metropolitanus]